MEIAPRGCVWKGAWSQRGVSRRPPPTPRHYCLEAWGVGVGGWRRRAERPRREEGGPTVSMESSTDRRVCRRLRWSMLVNSMWMGFMGPV